MTSLRGPSFVFHARLVVFAFSGITAGVAGAVFSSLPSYITPDTFLFELNLIFFVRSRCFS